MLCTDFAYHYQESMSCGLSKQVAKRQPVALLENNNINYIEINHLSWYEYDV